MCYRGPNVGQVHPHTPPIMQDQKTVDHELLSRMEDIQVYGASEPLTRVVLGAEWTFKLATRRMRTWQKIFKQRMKILYGPLRIHPKRHVTLTTTYYRSTLWLRVMTDFYWVINLTNFGEKLNRGGASTSE